MLFKRGSTSSVVKDAEEEGSGSDIEKPRTEADPKTREGSVAEDKSALAAAAPAMTDVFTWHHLDYVVPVHGGRRQLLDDVSGYVAPGKLTALMGESGAGKVCS